MRWMRSYVCWIYQQSFSRLLVVVTLRLCQQLGKRSVVFYRAQHLHKNSTFTMPPTDDPSDYCGKRTRTKVTESCYSSTESVTGGWWHLNWGGWACGNGWSGNRWNGPNYVKHISVFGAIPFAPFQPLLWAVLPFSSLRWSQSTQELTARHKAMVLWRGSWIPSGDFKRVRLAYI
jgi:hypothetical protein